MYFADSQEVAQRYSSMRSPDPAGQRVYSVIIPLGGLKVLDLTTDVRWKQYMEPLGPGLPSNEQLIKRANENYGKFFDSFCKKYKINLNDYDAVIGPEHLRGGKQMVILFKNGKPSVLQSTVRQNFRVVLRPGATPTRTPPGALTFKGKIGPGMRAGGRMAVATGASLVIGWLDNKLRERFAEEELKKLEPRIAQSIQSQTREVARIQMDGGKPFANVTLTTTTIYNRIGIFTPAQEESVSYPIIELKGVAISTSDLKSNSRVRTEAIIAPMEEDTVVYSIPLELSKEEIELYRSFVMELQWYDDAARGSVTAAALMQLNQDRLQLLKRFEQTFDRSRSPMAGVAD
jgi:hypothetical protein